MRTYDRRANRNGHFLLPKEQRDIAREIIRRHRCQECGQVFVCEACSESASEDVRLPQAYATGTLYSSDSGCKDHGRGIGVFRCDECRNGNHKN